MSAWHVNARRERGDIKWNRGSPTNVQLIQSPRTRGTSGLTNVNKGGSMNADLRLALRQLRKAPGFAITAVLTLALAIGANAIVFSVLNALVLRPLNVPHPENLFMLERNYGSETTPSQSYPDYRDLRDRNRSFDSLVDYDIMGGIGLDTGSGNPCVVWPYVMSGNYFDALGIQPYLGRFIHASEEHGKNSMPEIILSYSLWHSFFNSDRAAVGHTVQINKHPFTIVGVAPPDFRGTELFFAPDLWVPIVNAPQIRDWDSLEERGNHSDWVIGHLKPGVTPAAATSDLNTIADSLAKTYPKSDDGLKFSLSRPGLAGNTLGRPTRAFMAGLMLLAGLILLAACANLGSLFAARAADRSREIAVRMALGSRRQFILRQLLTEALLVSLAGGVCRHGGSRGHPARAQRVAANSGYSHQCAGESGCEDLPPGLLAGRFQRLVLRTGPGSPGTPLRSLADHSFWRLRALGGGRRFTLRDVLLGLQIAICAVLVTASLVAVRGLARSLESNYGIQPKDVMLVKTDLQMAGYNGDQRIADAEAHARCCRGDPRRYCCGICRPTSAEYWRRRLRSIRRHNHRLPAHECGSRCPELQHFAGLLPRRRDRASGRPKPDHA